MKQKDLFIRIIEAVTATGAEAHETATGAGTLYYDGTQHGEIFPIVFISIDRYKHGRDAARIAKEARKAAGRFNGVTVKEVEHPHFYIYQVFNKADAERAESLKKEAHIFLEAFHQERHRQHINGETDNQQKAIEAARAALKAAGIIAA